MRTKTLLVTALLSLAGVSAALAQASTNVYSVNVVGYVQVTVTNYGSVDRLLATPLGPIDNTNNFVTLLIPVASEGSQVTKLAPGGYEVVTYYEGLGWDNELALPVGTGFFIKLGWIPGNPAPPPVTITFVGDVQQRADSNMQLPAQLSLIGSLVPQKGDVATVLNMPGTEGNQVSRATPLGAWEVITYYEGLGWDNPLEIDVAEGFFYYNNSASTLPWVRDFVVQ